MNEEIIILKDLVEEYKYRKGKKITFGNLVGDVEIKAIEEVVRYFENYK